MNEQEVKDKIESFIVTNGVNAITADVLRPILIAMLIQPNEAIGDLDTLNTVTQDNLVDAINEIYNAVNNIVNDGIQLYQGDSDPNVEPPNSYDIADFYFEEGTQLWQFNGFEWIKVNYGDSINLPFKGRFDYIDSPIFSLPAGVKALDVRFNGTGSDINWNQLGDNVKYNGTIGPGDYLIVIGLYSNVPIGTIPSIEMVTSQGSRTLVTIQSPDAVNAEDLVNLGQTSITVQDIAELQAYVGEGLTVIVKDALRGGIFNYIETGVHNNGTVFTATGKGIGFWKRQFNQSEGLNVLWFGADPLGINDNADIFKDILVNNSYITNNVFIPKGNYKVTKTIGSINTSGTFTPELTNDLLFHGEKGSRIFVQDTITPEISCIIGIDTASINLKVKNIQLDANNIANRGIYTRCLVNDGTSANFKSQDVSLSNFYIGDNKVETSASGIYVYGAYDDVDVINCKIKSITTNSATLPMSGIFVNGTISGVGRFPKGINVFKNRIESIYRLGTKNKIDQDAINIGDGLLTSDKFGYHNIRENKLIDIAGRFIKVQGYNSDVVNNICVINDSFDTGVGNLLYAMDIQHSDGIIEGNEFIYKNTTGDNNLAIFSIVERVDDTRMKRSILSSNKIVGGNTRYLARFSETAGGENKSIMLVKDNVVDCDLESLVLFTGTTYAGVRKFNVIGNSVKSLNSSWVNNENSKTMELLLQGNVNRGTSKTAGNSIQKLTNIDNIGVTEVESFLKQGAFGLGATGTTGLALPSNNLNLTDTPDGTYSFTSVAIGNPAASSGTVKIARSGASGFFTQQVQLVNASDIVEVYFRHYRSSASVFSSWKKATLT